VVRKSVGESEPQTIAAPVSSITDSASPLPRLKDARATVVADFEEQYLKTLLKQTNGSVRQACRVSGLSRSRFYTLLKKYNISPSYSSLENK
jgi:two-component system NtrC family response regulator